MALAEKHNSKLGFLGAYCLFINRDEYFNVKITGSQYFVRLTVSCCVDKTVYCGVGDRGVWVCDLSSDSRQSLTLQQDFTVKKLWLATQSDQRHLLLILGDEILQNTSKIILFSRFKW